jgi:chemotaxis family two-component system sensor histidine kinase/response regulator PixL
MLALSLERAGYRVLQARDGQEALEQLQQSQAIGLIVCDVEMPNMNGFEFLTHRRQDATLAQIPTVMLTSRSNDKHRWLAMQLGATAYFTKPYLEQEFLQAIEELMGEVRRKSSSTR